MGYYLGVYRRTDMISSGRIVFKHQTLEKYLSIAPGTSNWVIGDKPGGTAAPIQSAAGANCPASDRNRYNRRLDKKSWMFSDNGEWHEDPTITVTCTNHHKVHEPVLTLASDGIAVEEGNLGQYSLSGEHNNSPYYVQTNTLSNSDSVPVYLYRADNNQWNVGPFLGKRGGWLKNLRASVSVPETGWKVFTNDRNGKGWRDDPQLTVRCGPLTECGDITVTSNGPTAEKKSDCLGVYKRTELMSCGRFVFKHQARHKYLSIAPGATNWIIGGKPGATKGYIVSAAGANCPASQRNRYSERLDKKSWMYSNNEDPSITVTCSNHSLNII